MMSLSTQQWLELKKETRDALVKIFRIPQSTYTHVVNEKLESDGHTYEDLKTISLEEMRLLTHSASEDFFEQFDLIIKMVEADGSTSPEAQPENATLNEQSVLTPVGAAEAGTDSGTKEGIIPKAQVSQEAVLPVSGGVNQVDRGSTELLPNLDGNNQASVAAKDAEGDVKKPKAGRAAK